MGMQTPVEFVEMVWTEHLLFRVRCGGWRNVGCSDISAECIVLSQVMRPGSLRRKRDVVWRAGLH